VAETLQLYFGGQRFGYFIRDGKQYEVIGEASRSNRDEPSDLSKLYVRNKEGEIIQMSNLVKLSEESNPPALYRYNRYIAATISAGLADGYTMGQGIEAMREIANEVLDPTFSTALGGSSKDFEESSGGLYFAFLLALALIYLALAAQFESFLDPLVIMFTVPLALAGSLLALYLGDHTMNIFSQIGIIVLVGIVTKNGILIVEFANQRMEAGLTVRDAVIEAATLRMRPILMTSLATVLGVTPIALALGSASTSRIPMGIAIIGGLLFSLLLTLYVIPAIFTFFNRDKKESSSTLKEEEEPIKQDSAPGTIPPLITEEPEISTIPVADTEAISTLNSVHDSPDLVQEKEQSPGDKTIEDPVALAGSHLSKQEEDYVNHTPGFLNIREAADSDQGNGSSITHSQALQEFIRKDFSEEYQRDEQFTDPDSQNFESDVREIEHKKKKKKDKKKTGKKKKKKDKKSK
jgi:hypothetical protein